jgi:RNA polymerase sigma-70 factor, ECF subfamily
MSRPRRTANVAFVGDRRAWAKALSRRDEGAAVAFFDEYVLLVERTISRILGADADIADATQDVFIRCLQSVHRLKDPQAMTQWVIQIAVCTASDWVRRRHRRRWLTFHDPTDIAKYPIFAADSASRDALRATYAVLDQLTVEERTAFALRFIDGMELKEVALACGCSLATIKRRLGRAEIRFEAIARKYRVLLPWLSESTSDRSDP